MRKYPEESYRFEGVEYHLRAFDDPTGQEKPCFVIEPKQGQEKEFQQVRQKLAGYLSERIGCTPEQVTWIEQRPSGDLTQFHFDRSYEQTFRPHAYDIAPQDDQGARDAERKGYLPVEQFTVVPSSEVRGEAREALETKLGEKLEPFEVRQQKQWAQAEAPAFERPSMDEPAPDQKEEPRPEPPTPKFEPDWEPEP